MSSTKLKVTFTDIIVNNDGDPTGLGELYWNLKVDGATVASRSVANPYKVGTGGIISLGQSAVVVKENQVGAKVVVSGTVSEKDNGFDGKDESDSFTNSHTYGNEWGTGQVQHAQIIDKKLNLQVNYVVERI